MSVQSGEDITLITVTTWTGWEANALRKALRMSVTSFAEHLGAARRTVAKWSSRGHDIELRAEMQAALDTVLVRASAETQNRFEEFCALGTTDAPGNASSISPTIAVRPTADIDLGERGECHQDDAMRRRELLMEVTASGVAVVPGVARLLDVLLTPASPSAEHWATLSVRRFATAVAAAKNDYQACRYEILLRRLAALLPTTALRTHLVDDDRQVVDVLTTDLYHVVGSVLLKFGDPAMALVAAERSVRSGLTSGDPVAAPARGSWFTR